MVVEVSKNTVSGRQRRSSSSTAADCQSRAEERWAVLRNDVVIVLGCCAFLLFFLAGVALCKNESKLRVIIFLLGFVTCSLFCVFCLRVDFQTWTRCGFLVIMTTSVLLGVAYPLWKSTQDECVHVSLEYADADIFCIHMFKIHSLPPLLASWSAWSVLVSSTVFRLGTKLTLCVAAVNFASLLCVSHLGVSHLAGRPAYEDITKCDVGAMANLIHFLVLGLLIGRQQDQLELANVIFKLDRAQARARAEAILNHHIKNTLAETMATMELYMNGDVAKSGLSHCVKIIQQALQFLQQSMLVSKIEEGTYAPKPMTVDLKQWTAETSPQGIHFMNCKGTYRLEDKLISDLFMALSYGNCNAHGAGDIVVETCLFRDTLRIDIHNRMHSQAGVDNSNPSRKCLLRYSTGFGIQDLRSICHKRGITFVCKTYNDGRWHSVIEMPAVCVEEDPSDRAAIDVQSMPDGLSWAIIDDQKTIPKFVAMKIRKVYPHAVTNTYVIDNISAYRKFCDYTVPEQCTLWDVVVMDQHLLMEDKPGVVMRGTQLIHILKSAGCKACFIMHSGNASEEQSAAYAVEGFHGTVGKGSKKLMDCVQTVYMGSMKKDTGTKRKLAEDAVKEGNKRKKKSI